MKPVCLPCWRRQTDTVAAWSDPPRDGSDDLKTCVHCGRMTTNGITVEDAWLASQLPVADSFRPVRPRAG